MPDKKRGKKTQKYGFLTQTQRDYILGKIAVKTPAKVMNYRIRQAFEKAAVDFYDDYDYIRYWKEFDRCREDEVIERMHNFKSFKSYAKAWRLWTNRKKDHVIIPMSCHNCGYQWDEKFYKDEYGAVKSWSSLPPVFQVNKNVLLRALKMDLSVGKICEESLNKAIDDFIADAKKLRESTKANARKRS
jgi:predicted Zn-ribbon and HTH transcriptional regulator